MMATYTLYRRKKRPQIKINLFIKNKIDLQQGLNNKSLKLKCRIIVSILRYNWTIIRYLINQFLKTYLH